MSDSGTIIALWIIMIMVILIVVIICGAVYIIAKSARNIKQKYEQEEIMKQWKKQNIQYQQPQPQPRPIYQQQIQQPVYQQPVYQQPIQIPERVRIYQRKNLLTKNEYIFYRNLKNFADKYNLQILSKIRVADIVEPKPNTNKSEWFSDFGKIKSKHVDFAIANKDNLYILCLIELDDNTHQKPDRIERDIFIDQVYQSVRIPIIHTKYFNEQTETQLRYVLGIAPEQPRADGAVPTANDF